MKTNGSITITSNINNNLLNNKTKTNINSIFSYCIFIYLFLYLNKLNCLCMQVYLTAISKSVCLLKHSRILNVQLVFSFKSTLFYHLWSLVNLSNILHEIYTKLAHLRIFSDFPNQSPLFLFVSCSVFSSQIIGL